MACIGGVSGEWVLRILYLYLHLFLYYLYQYSRFTISLNHKDNQSSQLGERVSAWLGLESRYKSICGEILRPLPHSFKNNWEEIHFEMCTLTLVAGTWTETKKMYHGGFFFKLTDDDV